MQIVFNITRQLPVTVILSNGPAKKQAAQRQKYLEAAKY